MTEYDIFGSMFIQSSRYSGSNLSFVGQEQNCKTVELMKKYYLEDVTEIVSGATPWTKENRYYEGRTIS